MATAAIDAVLNGWAARVRMRYLAIGKDFGSDRTVAVANVFINGMQVHGDKLKGVGPQLVAKLVWARDGLVASGLDRGEKRLGITLLSGQLGERVKAGRLQRGELRALLSGAHEELLAVGDVASDDEADAVDGALQRTARVAEDPGPLADQIVMLANVLARPAVRAVVEADVEAELVESQTLADGLRALDAASARPLGTPEETQRLDLLDGLVVTIVRRIHKAAVVASKRLGDDLLLKVFSLDELYRVAQPGRNTPG